MSVAEPLRHKGRLEVHVKAQFLATYTAEILKNQKIFNPEVDKNLIDRIRWWRNGQKRSDGQRRDGGGRNQRRNSSHL